MVAPPWQPPRLARSGKRLTIRPPHVAKDAGQIGLAIAFESTPRAPADDRLAVIRCGHAVVGVRFDGLRFAACFGAGRSSFRPTGSRTGSTMRRRLNVPIRMST